MKLCDFILKMRVNKRKMSRELRINESTLYKYINREREPKLDIAIRIVELTKGRVGFKDLLMKSYKPVLDLYELTEAGKKEVKDDMDDFL